MSNDLNNALRLLKDYCNSTDGLTCIEGKCPVHRICLLYFKETPEHWEFDYESNIESDV